jgi:hypothetical protein
VRPPPRIIREFLLGNRSGLSWRSSSDLKLFLLRRIKRTKGSMKEVDITRKALINAENAVESAGVI